LLNVLDAELSRPHHLLPPPVGAEQKVRRTL